MAIQTRQASGSRGQPSVTARATPTHRPRAGAVRSASSRPVCWPGDWDGAAVDAEWTLERDAAAAASPIGRYAACLALLILGRDEEARPIAHGLRTNADFPAEVGDALAMIAAQDP